MNGWRFALLILGLASIAITVMLCVVEHEARKPKKNRRLPPPDIRTQRSPDWRRYELHTPRKYIP